MPGRLIEPVLAAAAFDAEEAALFLILGGLFMLLTVLTLVLVRSLFPTAAGGASERRIGPMSRGLLPTPDLDRAPLISRVVAVDATALERGRRAAEEGPAPEHVDEILGRLAGARWGDGRLLGQRAGRLRFRIYGCQECARAKGAVAGCGFHAGYLGASIDRLQRRPHRVSEVACIRHGAPVCEFEVVPV